MIGEAIRLARNAAQTSAKREAASASASASAINGVLDRFRGVTEAMEASTAVLKQESAGIQSEIVDALVQLQFQDRVSQRMTHVRHNIERLPDLLKDSRRRCFDASGALTGGRQGAARRARRRYAMADERATPRNAGRHAGGGPSPTSPKSHSSESVPRPNHRETHMAKTIMIVDDSASLRQS